MRLSLVLVMILVLGGCRATMMKPTQQDDVRKRLQQVQDELDRKTREVEELEHDLAAMARETEQTDPEIVQATPRVTSITIGSLSDVRWNRHKDDLDATLTLYLHPLDGQGRFLQLVGSVQVTVVVLPEHGDAVTLARVQIGPMGLRRAWRSGFMGTHYTLEIPLELEGELQDAKDCIVRVRFTDGYSNEEFVAESVIELPQDEDEDLPSIVSANQGATR